MSWWPYLVVLSAALLVRSLAFRAMGAAAPVGDEHGYIGAGAEPDPYAPGQFLRVPLMAWLSMLGHRISANPERMLRRMGGAASMLSIVATMASAQILGGWPAALCAGLLMTLMPGRIVLSRHIWPDIWLGLWLSLICLVLVYPDLPPDRRSLLLGLIAALAFLTRFDALLLAPLAGIGMGPSSPEQWVYILLPAAAAFLLLAIRNARRYGVPWPDTTWMFNLMIAANETDRGPTAPVFIENEVQRVMADWKQLSYRGRLIRSLASLRTLLTRPLRACWGLATRLWASLGPDSFVLYRLLPPEGIAYPQISGPFCRLLRVALTVAFPLFTVLMVLVLLLDGLSQPVLLATLALAVGGLIHNRTRYRQAWLPGAVLIVAPAIGAADFRTLLLSADAIPHWIAGAAIGLALVFLRVRPDTRREP